MYLYHKETLFVLVFVLFAIITINVLHIYKVLRPFKLKSVNIEVLIRKFRPKIQNYTDLLCDRDLIVNCMCRVYKVRLQYSRLGTFNYIAKPFLFHMADHVLLDQRKSTSIYMKR